MNPSEAVMNLLVGILIAGAFWYLFGFFIAAIEAWLDRRDREAHEILKHEIRQWETDLRRRRRER